MKIITKKMVLILALLLCLIFLSSCATVRSLLIYMNGGREDYYISGIDAHLEPDHVVFESTVNFYHEQKDVLYKYEYTNADFHFFSG